MSSNTNKMERQTLVIEKCASTSNEYPDSLANLLEIKRLKKSVRAIKNASLKIIRESVLSSLQSMSNSTKTKLETGNKMSKFDEKTELQRLMSKQGRLERLKERHSRFTEKERKLYKQECLKRKSKVPSVETFPIKIIGADDEGNGLFNCIICREEYDTLVGIRRHYIANHIESEVLKAKEKQGRDAEAEGMEFLSRVYKCELCPEKCYTVPSYRRHIIATHKENWEFLNQMCFACSFCEEAFYMKFQLITHLREMHEIFTKCPICNEHIKTQELFVLHLNKVHIESNTKEIIVKFENGYYCKVCGFDSECYNTVETHSQNHPQNKIFNCDLCAHTFDSQKRLDSHMKFVHLEKTFCCEECGKQFVSVRALRWHKRRHGNAISPKNNLVECKECGKTFSTPSNYKAHYLAAHTNKKFKCYVCGKEFNSQPNLHMHKITICEKEKAVARDCPICGKTFPNYILLSHHKTNIHKYGNTEENVCHICNKIVKNSMTLLLHNNMHHKDKINVNEADNQSVPQCSICAKNCPTKQKLLEHWRSHRDEKPYKCSSCEMPFKYPYQFYAHRKKDHQQNQEKPKAIINMEADNKLKADFKAAHAFNMTKKGSIRSGLGSATESDQDQNHLSTGALKCTEKDVSVNNGHDPAFGHDVNDWIMNRETFGSNINIANASAKMCFPTDVNNAGVNDVDNSGTNLPELQMVQQESNKNNFPNVGTDGITKEKINHVDLSALNVPVQQRNNCGISADSFEICGPSIICSESSTHKMPGTTLVLVEVDIFSGISEIKEPIDEFCYPMDLASLVYCSDNDETIGEDKKPFLVGKNVYRDPFEKRLIVEVERLTECLACSQVFASMFIYKQHMSSKQHTLRVNVKGNSRKIGGTSIKKSKKNGENEIQPNKKRQLVRTKAIQQESFSCRFCNEMFSSASKYTMHTRQHQTRENCLLCPEKFTGVRKLVTHYISEHNGQKIIKCEVCDKGFLEYHRKTLNAHRRNNCRQEKRKTIRKKNAFPCDLCGEKIRGWKLFETHLHSHSNDKHNCANCSQKFNGLILLESHYKEVHDGEMPFACTKCSQSFSIQFRLDLHDKDAHPDEKYVRDPTDGKVACDICGRKFRCSSRLVSHRATHGSKEERKNYSCDICDKSYSDGYKLNIHRRTHTGEKPYVCSICGPDVAFISSTHLNDHVDRVHKTKSHLCDTCGKAFYLRKRLQEHRKRHRPNPELAHCKLCPAKFSQPKALEKHMNQLHDPNRPFGCDQCGCRFNYTSNVILHKKGVHEGMGVVYPKLNKKERNRKKGDEKESSLMSV